MQESEKMNLPVSERRRIKATHNSQKETTGKLAHGKRRPETRRQEILDAALVVFTEKGFSAARINDIAKRARICSGTMYLYFASKDEIFKNLVKESIGTQVSQLALATREFEGSSDDLLRLVARTIGIFLSNSNRAVLSRLIICETGNFPELARFYREHVTDRMLEIFEEIVRRGIARDEFRKIHPADCARMILAMLMFTAIWRTGLGSLDGKPYDYERYIETNLDLVLHGLAKATPS